MTAPTPTSLPLLQGRYRIEERLGASRLAMVYRAFDERLQRMVLVHMLRREHSDQPALRERFLQEAQHGAGRSHGSLLDVYDTGELAGRPFLITEYISGRPLRELGRLAPEDALLYFRQIVGAVAACQASGAPHPPISSSNVILVGEGHVELIESWLTALEDVPRDLACYRPPERASGAPLTPAGAVYSLGLLLVELLSGKRPVDGDDARTVARAHLSASIPPLSQLQPRIFAPGLERLIQQATARDPHERLPDAAALAHALDDLRQALDSETRRLPVTPQPSMADRVRRSTGRMVRPATIRPRRPVDDTDQSPPISAAPPGGRAIIGLVLVGVLLLAVVCGAYSIASLAAENLTSIRLPRPEIALPELGIVLPEWLTGVVEGSGEVLEVTIVDTEGLNLRAEPGLRTRVITLLPNGTRVRRVDGPRVVDDVPWMLVRVSVEGREIEGWVAARYVRPV